MTTTNPYDFLPRYPAISTTSDLAQMYSRPFNEVISKKKEFNDLRLEQSQPEPKQGVQFNHQELVARFLSAHTPYDELLLFHSPGTGKCHAKGTKILMFDGTLCNVENIKVGDRLMGDDSTPRVVLSLARGKGPMYRIENSKREVLYEVNDAHILVLKDKEDRVVEIPVKEYKEEYDASKGYVGYLGYSVPIEFPPQPEPCVDPYSFGEWISDDWNGKRNEPVIIPDSLLLGSRQIRMQLLAGIIDTQGVTTNDNTAYEVMFSSIHSSVKFLCKSLGYICVSTERNTLLISGPQLNEIPVKNWCYSDRPQSKDSLTYEISVTELPFDRNYYGFTVDGNSRYVLGDSFTVTHNSCSAIHSIETILADKDKYGITKSVILVKNDVLIKQFRHFIVHTCTNNKYFIEDGPVFPTEAKHKYHLYTYQTFFNDFESNMELAVSKYSNSVIVIDEIHDLLHTKMYSFFFEFLHRTQNRKILLLTGTPMNNSASDMALLMNLILPRTQLLPIGKAFDEVFLDEKENLTELGAELMAQATHGRVSYLRSRVDIVSQYQGDRVANLSFPVTQAIMSEHQTSSFQVAQGIDATDQGSFYIQSLNASLFVFPDGSFGTSGYQKNVKVKKGGVHGAVPRYSCDSIQSAMRGLRTNEEKLAQIHQWSCKYATIIKHIVDHPDQNTFIYMKSITGSGAIVLGLCLEYFGYQRATGDNAKPGKRYAILSGETGTSWENIKRSFNRESNSRGQYLQVIIGGEQVKQGITFYSIQQIHVALPEWNFANLDQAIARGIRINAHRFLPPKTPVKIFLHVAEPRKGESIDLHLYQVGQQKDRAIKQIEYIVKINSMDCALNYERNKEVDGENGSRQCEYNDCLYRCKDVTFPYNSENLIMDTYQLFYTQEYLSVLVRFLEDVFRVQTHVHLLELKPLLRITMFQLLQAITTIMQKQMILYNRYGFPCFLKEDHNVLFLVDSVHADTFPSCFYTEYPVIEHVEVSPHYNDFMDLRLVMNEPNVDKKITLIQSLPLHLQELFIEHSVASVQKPPLVQAVLNAYASVIQRENGTFISTLLAPKIRKLQSNRKWVDVVIDRETKRSEDEELMEDKVIRGRGWIGKRAKNGNFNILDLRDVLNNTKKVTERIKKDKGQNCSTRDLDVIRTIMSDLGIVPPDSFTTEDSIRILKKNKMKVQDYMKARNGKQLSDLEQRTLAWTLRGKKILCADIEAWFIENDLIL